MSYTTRDEFAVLHGLRVCGITSAQPVAISTGIDRRVVQNILDDAVARQLARSRTSGRLQGYLITDGGRERHAALRAQLLSPADVERLTPVYSAFLAPNRQFTVVVTRWQTEGPDARAAVLDGLREVHAAATALVSEAAAVVPRMRAYQGRLNGALEGFRAGDDDALGRPMTGSYRDVWTELHKDLLVTLDRRRDDADE